MIYVSSHGWSMELVANWQPLAVKSATASPVIFVTADNASLHMSWIKTARPVDSKVVEAFDVVTMLAGALNREEALGVLQRIWPPFGELLSANVVEMPDGKKGIETTERTAAGANGKSQCIYQLLVPVDQSGSGHFQRVYFFAPAQDFEKSLPQVIQMSRSLRSGKAIPKSDG